MFFRGHAHHVSAIHRNGVPSAYSKYLPARGPSLATRMKPWRVGLAVFWSALHAAHWKLPLTALRPASVDDAEYDHSPDAGGAKRAFQFWPPSQKPATLYRIPRASPATPVNVTDTYGLPPSGSAST